MGSSGDQTARMKLDTRAEGPSKINRIGLIRRLLETRLGRQRLSGSLSAFRIELDCRRRSRGGTNGPAYDASQEALSAAQEALHQGDVNSGWKLLHAAERHLIPDFDQDEIDAKAELLRREASEKLSGWRRDAIDKLLPHPQDRESSKASRVALLEATKIRDDASDNTYFKIGLLQDQIGILSIVSVTAIGLLCLLAFLHRMPLDQDVLAANWEALMSVMLFGVLGGAISGAFSLARVPTSSKITEQVANRLITLLRIAVGAAAALVVYALLKSAIFPKVFSFETNSPGTVLFLSFVAGFTEQLVVKAVSSVVR